MLTPSSPTPPNHGLAIRVYHLATALAKDHTVRVMFPHRGRFDVNEVDVPTLEPVPISSDGSLRYRITKHIKCLFGTKPPEFEASWDGEFTRRVREAAESGNYDLVHVDHLSMARYGLNQSNLPVIFTAHNVESSLRERILSYQGNNLLSQYARLKARQLLAYEKEIVARVQTVVTVSERDAQVYRNWGKLQNVYVVPNGVDTTYFNFSPPPISIHRSILLYTGLMSYMPNIDAVSTIASSILPLIHTQGSDVELLVVGREPTPDVMRLASPQVTITGEVPDVRPFLKRAHALCVPLRAGGGTRLKILEAMASGLPVVSTAIGIEGIDAVPGKHYLLAETPSDFAQAILALSRDRSLATDIAHSARELVEQRYTWSSSAVVLEDVLQRSLWR